MSEVKMKKRSFLIRFYNILCSDLNWHYIPTTNCHWSPKSSYHNMLPLEVNNHYIQFINNTDNCKLLHVTKQHSLCVCTNELHYDCHINDLGYLYAGQTLTMQLHRRHYKVTTANTVVVKTDIDQQYSTPCIVLGSSENIQFINKNCTKVYYTIGFPTDNWCELFLKIASDSDMYLNIFYIKQITCPTGFVKRQKMSV